MSSIIDKTQAVRNYRLRIIGRRDDKIKMTEIRPDMSEAEIDKRFQYCLDEFLVDVPPDFYNEGKLLFIKYSNRNPIQRSR